LALELPTPPNSSQAATCRAGAAKKFGLPFVGVFADFPQYRSREGEVGTLEERINGCMTRSLNGRALPVGSDEMKAFVAYLEFLSADRPIGAKTLARGSGEMAERTRPADSSACAKVFAQTCAACHGDDGQGKRVGVTGDTKGYEFPPIWGSDSFNNGRHGAPDLGRELYSQQHAERHHLRPACSICRGSLGCRSLCGVHEPAAKGGLDKEFPVRSEKSADAGYGPYAMTSAKASTSSAPSNRSATNSAR
jgi:thiosulfate dehydrogenase